MTVRCIQVKDKDKEQDIYPEPRWLTIANEKDNENNELEDAENDDTWWVYYYLEDEFDMNALKIGQEINLDEDFIITDLCDCGRCKEHYKNAWKWVVDKEYPGGLRRVC